MFSHIDRSKILSFVIDVSENKKQISTHDVSRIVFTHVLTTFSNLRYLKIGPSLTWYHGISFGISPPSLFSSTLLELHVSLISFTDCLYLLDGRFDQLHTLHVNIPKIAASTSTIKNEVNYLWLIFNPTDFFVLGQITQSEVFFISLYFAYTCL